MTLQCSVAVRNAMLDAIEAAIGTGAIVKIRTGAQPATCATADSGTVLATITTPTDYMNAASGGTKTKLGTWDDASADAGTATAAGHFRVYASDGTTCGMQGTVTLTGAGGDMTVDGTFTAGQAFSITGFTLTAGNP